MSKVQFNGSYIEYFNRNKICFHCGSPFEPKDKVDILCSDTCRNAFREGKEILIQNFLSNGAKMGEIKLEDILEKMMEISAKQTLGDLTK